MLFFALWVFGLMAGLEAPRPGFYDVAEAIADIAQDPLPAPYDTPERSAALMVSIGWFESRFTLKARNRESCGLYQTPCPAPATLEEQTRVAYNMVRDSIAKCGDMTGYVSGWCGRAPTVAMWRERLARRLIAPAKSCTQ